MVWPTDDLTNTHTNDASDDPAQARIELDNLILKVKAILAEVTAGATVWHSGNDGSGSGLDADKFDSYESASFQTKGDNLEDLRNMNIVKGKIPVFTSTGLSFISLGSNDEVLTVDGSVGVGVKWATAASVVAPGGTVLIETVFVSSWQNWVEGTDEIFAHGMTPNQPHEFIVRLKITSGSGIHWDAGDVLSLGGGSRIAIPTSSPEPVYGFQAGYDFGNTTQIKVVTSPDGIAVYDETDNIAILTGSNTQMQVIAKLWTAA